MIDVFIKFFLLCNRIYGRFFGSVWFIVKCKCIEIFGIWKLVRLGIVLVIKYFVVGNFLLLRLSFVSVIKYDFK